jgi:23S rRNA (guanine745-N1)-methyltransferase
VSCPKGHSFDLSRSGYLNLLQPQDKKSSRPGDSREAVQARGRSLQRGLGERLRDELAAVLGQERGGQPGRLLDVGCGEGYFLREVCRSSGWEGWGMDLSVAAVEAAARSLADGHWVVANADRKLPALDRSFSAVMSITARKNGPEFQRVLEAGGLLLVAVAGSDDLQELREAVLGEAVQKDRAALTAAALEPWFELQRQVKVSARHALEPEALRDLLQGSYRGSRFSVQRKAEQLQALEVTISYELLCLRARAV